MAEPVTIARPYAEAVFKLASVDNNEGNSLAAWSDAIANIDGVVADPRVQQFKPQQYLADYPGYEAYKKMTNLGITHLTAVPLHIGGRLTGFMMLASHRTPYLTAADRHILAGSRNDPPRTTRLSSGGGPVGLSRGPSG